MHKAAHIVRISLSPFLYAGNVLLGGRETVLSLLLSEQTTNGEDRVLGATTSLSGNVLYDLTITANSFLIRKRNLLPSEIGPLTGGLIALDKESNPAAYFGTSQVTCNLITFQCRILILSNTLQDAESMIVKISTHELEILERHELNSSSYSAVLNQANNRILFGTEKCVPIMSYPLV